MRERIFRYLAVYPSGIDFAPTFTNLGETMGVSKKLKIFIALIAIILSNDSSAKTAKNKIFRYINTNVNTAILMKLNSRFSKIKNSNRYLWLSSAKNSKSTISPSKSTCTSQVQVQNKYIYFLYFSENVQYMYLPGTF